MEKPTDTALPDAPPRTLPLLDNGLPGRAAPPQRPPSRGGRWRLIPLVFVAMFTGGVIGMYFQPPALRAFFGVTGLEPGGGTDTPIAIATAQVLSQQEVAVVSEGDIVALGRVLPLGDVISIATPYGAGDARISALNVTAGDRVKAGDVLATLDNRDPLLSAVEAARATVAVREASLMQTREALLASRAETQAALERAQATETEARSDLGRIAALHDRGVATRADLDQAAARAAEARRDVERTLATLSRFDPEAGTARADIAVAEANLQAARVEVTRTERNLAQATVVAPADGTILSITAKVGERPGNDGILDMGDTSQMVVEAEVYQTLIGRVALGDPVTVTAEALPEALAGTVRAIGLEIGRQSITSDDPAANTDARVVDVLIWLDPASSARRLRRSVALLLVALYTLLGTGSRPGVASWYRQVDIAAAHAGGEFFSFSPNVHVVAGSRPLCGFDDPFNTYGDKCAAAFFDQDQVGRFRVSQADIIECLTDEVPVVISSDAFWFLEGPLLDHLAATDGRLIFVTPADRARFEWLAGP